MDLMLLGMLFVCQIEIMLFIDLNMVNYDFLCVHSEDYVVN